MTTDKSLLRSISEEDSGGLVVSCCCGWVDMLLTYMVDWLCDIVQ